MSYYEFINKLGLADTELARTIYELYKRTNVRKITSLKGAVKKE